MNVSFACLNDRFNRRSSAPHEKNREKRGMPMKTWWGFPVISLSTCSGFDHLLFSPICFNNFNLRILMWINFWPHMKFPQYFASQQSIHKHSCLVWLIINLSAFFLFAPRCLVSSAWRRECLWELWILRRLLQPPNYSPKLRFVFAEKWFPCLQALFAFAKPKKALIKVL